MYNYQTAHNRQIKSQDNLSIENLSNRTKQPSFIRHLPMESVTTFESKVDQIKRQGFEMKNLRQGLADPNFEKRRGSSLQEVTRSMISTPSKPLPQKEIEHRKKQNQSYTMFSFFKTLGGLLDCSNGGKE